MTVALDLARHLYRNRQRRRVKRVHRLGNVIVRTVQDDVHATTRTGRPVHAELPLHIVERPQGGDAQRMRYAPLVDFGVTRLTYRVSGAPRTQLVDDSFAPVLGQQFGIGDTGRHLRGGEVT